MDEKKKLMGKFEGLAFLLNDTTVCGEWDIDTLYGEWLSQNNDG